jgi:hypothetical protein
VSCGGGWCDVVFPGVMWCLLGVMWSVLVSRGVCWCHVVFAGCDLSNLCRWCDSDDMGVHPKGVTMGPLEVGLRAAVSPTLWHAARP